MGAEEQFLTVSLSANEKSSAGRPFYSPNSRNHTQTNPRELSRNLISAYLNGLQSNTVYIIIIVYVYNSNINNIMYEYIFTWIYVAVMVSRGVCGNYTPFKYNVACPGSSSYI